MGYPHPLPTLLLILLDLSSHPSIVKSPSPPPPSPWDVAFPHLRHAKKWALATFSSGPPPAPVISPGSLRSRGMLPALQRLALLDPEVGEQGHHHLDGSNSHDLVHILLCIPSSSH